MANLDIELAISFLNLARALASFTTHAMPRHVIPNDEYALPNILQTWLNVVEFIFKEYVDLGIHQRVQNCMPLDSWKAHNWKSWSPYY